MTRFPARAVARTLAAALLATFAVAGAASAATTVTSGVLYNDLGVPSAGAVRVYATLPQGGVSPLLGIAQAAPDGSFSVQASDPAEMAALAKPRRGWLDWVAVAQAGGREGQWFSTSYIDASGGQVRSVHPDSVAPPSAGAARVAAAAPAPRITITARRALPRALMQGEQKCTYRREEQRERTYRQLAVVGELNNAYNDGTKATFTYGQGGESATWFGAAVSYGANFFIEGENYAAFEGETRFPPARRRYARKLRSGFEFTRYAVRNMQCKTTEIPWDITIRATGWLANQDTSVKQSGTLNRCDPAAFLHEGIEPGGAFKTSNTTAVRWTRGVSLTVPGPKGAQAEVGITTRSGFDERVSVKHDFGGRKGKQHYLCGPDGRQSPASAGRIFSGAIRP